jgi:hypothetical protein
VQEQHPATGVALQLRDGVQMLPPGVVNPTGPVLNTWTVIT